MRIVEAIKPPWSQMTPDTGDFLELPYEQMERMASSKAGADPYKGDRLGRLAVSKRGLAERDRLVFAHCRAAGRPVAVAMAGGYARDVEDTVEIHLRTVREAIRPSQVSCPPPSGRP